MDNLELFTEVGKIAVDNLKLFTEVEVDNLQLTPKWLDREQIIINNYSPKWK